MYRFMEYVMNIFGVCFVDGCLKFWVEEEMVRLRERIRDVYVYCKCDGWCCISGNVCIVIVGFWSSGFVWCLWFKIGVFIGKFFFEC